MPIFTYHKLETTPAFFPGKSFSSQKLDEPPQILEIFGGISFAFFQFLWQFFQKLMEVLCPLGP